MHPNLMHEIQLGKINKNCCTMNNITIKERKKTDAGTGVQMSKYLHHNSLAARDNDKWLVHRQAGTHKRHCIACPRAHGRATEWTFWKRFLNLPLTTTFTNWCFSPAASESACLAVVVTALCGNWQALPLPHGAGLQSSGRKRRVDTTRDTTRHC